MLSLCHKYTLPLVHTVNEYNENTKLILQKRAYSFLCANHSRAGLKPELLYAKTNQLSDMSENTSDLQSWKIREIFHSFVFNSLSISLTRYFVSKFLI